MLYRGAEQASHHSGRVWGRRKSLSFKLPPVHSNLAAMLPFDLLILVDGLVSRIRGGPSADTVWRSIPIDPDLVLGKRELRVTLAVSACIRWAWVRRSGPLGAP